MDFPFFTPLYGTTRLFRNCLSTAPLLILFPGLPRLDPPSPDEAWTSPSAGTRVARKRVCGLGGDPILGSDSFI